MHRLHNLLAGLLDADVVLLDAGQCCRLGLMHRQPVLLKALTSLVSLIIAAPRIRLLSLPPTPADTVVGHLSRRRHHLCILPNGAGCFLVTIPRGP